MTKRRIFTIAATIIAAFLYWYIFTPAVNIHDFGFLFGTILIAVLYAVLNSVFCNDHVFEDPKSWKEVRGIRTRNGKVSPGRVATYLGVLIVLVILVSGLIAWPLWSSGSYADVAGARIEQRNFTEDIPEEKQISSLALMDTASAEIIGNRQMGSLNELVSQFETSVYTTSNYQAKPVKLSPLKYAGFFRFLRNYRSGVPGFISVDPVTQKAKYVAVEQGMRYLPDAYFNHKLERHIHFKYPTVIIDDTYFELDEEGHPWFICPYVRYRVSLFGGKDIAGAVIVDPVTGEMNKYKLEDIPTWVDRVYSGELLCEQYDWWGLYKNGYINSLFAKVGCTVTTEDYGYKALDNDIWVFTGVTSVVSDESNIGFVLMNSRTGEIRYYDIYGAEEYSAMGAAEGQVQNLRYTASFPMIINLENEPVYMMVLKDDGGLTKMYALVNLQDYSIVATGVSQTEVLKNYKLKIGQLTPGTYDETVECTVEEIRFAQIDGETYAYLLSGETAYKIKVSENERVMMIRVGDKVSLMPIEQSGNGGIVVAILADNP